MTVYKELKDNPEENLTIEEQKLKEYLVNKFRIYPINRIRLRKNYSDNAKEISIDIELDAYILSEEIYNKIVNRLFYEMESDKVILENPSEKSNFNYYFLW